jgi:two-component system sensor histidine kinase PilS (NtrC family)
MNTATPDVSARQEPVNWTGLLGIMMLRLGFLFSFLIVLSWFMPGDGVAFYAFMALAYIVTIPYSLWLRDEERLSRMLPLQFIVDLVIVTGLVYFTGGVESDLALLYPLVILSAGLVTSAQRAMQVTVLSILVYSITVILMAHGVLIPYLPGIEPVMQPWSQVVQSLLLRCSAFICFGLGSVYIARRCHFLDDRAARYRKLAELIFRRMPAGVLVVDGDGVVRMANDRFRQMLGLPQGAVEGLPLTSLAAPGLKLPAVGPAGESFTCSLVSHDGMEMPVRVHATAMQLPVDVLQPGTKGAEEVAVTVLAVRDISRIIELRDQIAIADRMLTAANLTERLADQVRPPLAAISWAAQVMQRLDHKVLVGQQLNDAGLQNELAHLTESIVEESSRLDGVIEKFIDLAEISPKALAKIARMADTAAFES